MRKKTIPNTGAVLMNATPFLGGGGLGKGQDGREVLVRVETPAAGVMLQGHDGLDEPATNDPEWFTLLTGVVGTTTYEIKLPRWVRRGTAGGTAGIHLEADF